MGPATEIVFTGRYPSIFCLCIQHVSNLVIKTMFLIFFVLEINFIHKKASKTPVSTDGDINTGTCELGKYGLPNQM